MIIYLYKNSLNFFIEKLELTYRLSKNEKKLLKVERKKVPKGVETFTYEELYGEVDLDKHFVPLWGTLNIPFAKDIEKALEDLCKLFLIEKTNDKLYAIKVDFIQKKDEYFPPNNQIVFSWYSLEYPLRTDTVFRYMGAMYLDIFDKFNFFFYNKTDLNYQYQFKDDFIYLKLKRLAEP